MAEDLELNLDLDEEPNINNRAEERIKDLSSKAKYAYKERDEAKAAAEAAETARLSLEKERDFFAGLSDITTKFPGASEHKEAIKDKYLSGYTLEDAAVAVLNSEGKLLPQAEVQAQAGPAAGGSAPIQLDGGSKSINDMSLEEKRNALVEAEKTGEVSQLLTRGMR